MSDQTPGIVLAIFWQDECERLYNELDRLRDELRADIQHLKREIGTLPKPTGPPTGAYVAVRDEVGRIVNVFRYEAEPESRTAVREVH